MKYPITAVAFVICLGNVGANGGSYQARVEVHWKDKLGAIHPGIYGQYLEHVQADEQTIYPSLWDSESPFANAQGIRTDVTSAVKAMGVPVVRWPGGCFADVYHWEDGIGPQKARQPKPNLHWKGMESNRFGTDEFLQWCALADTRPYINVNLGTGTLDEALRWLEYCNGAKATAQGRRRAANGHGAPYGVTYWGIGNETWGPWEAGHTDAATYGTSLSLWARAMRKADPNIRILGVGSDEANDTRWDKEVLARAGKDIDLLTVHMYGITTRYDGAEYEAYVLTPAYFEDRLRKLLRTIDESTASLGRKQPVNLSIDEWNIRHFYEGKQDRKSPRTLQDAVFSAGFLNAMVRLSPRVEMANYVFLVNGNATLLVNDKSIVWTPLAYLFQQYARWMQGTALDVKVTSPGIVPPAPLIAGPGRKPQPDYQAKEVPWLDVAAAKNPHGPIALSLVNRHQTDAAEVEVKMDNTLTVVEIWSLSADDILSKNTFENPAAITPRIQRAADPSMPRHTITCPPHSVTLLYYWK